MGIPNAPPSNTIANRLSNTPTNPPQTRRPAPQPPQPPTQSSAIAYPPARGVPWKCITAMMWEETICPERHFNHLDDSPRLKFYQEVGCPVLAKHGYICRKYVTASAKVVDRFNNKFPRITDQAQISRPVTKRVSDDSSSNQVSARRIHSPSISNYTLDSTVPPALIVKNVLLVPNHVASIPTSDGYTDIYSSDSGDEPLFEEMFSNFKTVKSINTYSLVPQLLTLASTPTKVLNKQRKIRGREKIATIKRVQSDTTSSSRFLFTDLHSVSQDINCAHTDKIYLYNKKDTAFCADSGSS